MKKLLNKKGSVLFLVVVVMSLLIIAASATYYVVSSQRSSVEVHYASEQSYQTALSVSETVEGYLAAVLKQVSKGDIDYKNTIFKKMMDMSPTDTLVASKDLREYGLGGFDIEIKKDPALSTEDESVFNITTKSEVNGETTTLTQVWKVKLTEEETKYFTRFLTSTGKDVGEDTFLRVQQVYGENYFENEFTTIERPTYIHRSMYSTGTLIDKGFSYDDEFSDKEIVVAGNYYRSGASESNRVNRVIVGGDMNIKSSSNEILNAEAVYVLGDLYIDAPFSCSTDSTKPTNIFVYGNCYVKNKINGGCKIYVENDMYWQGADWDGSNGELHVNHDIHYTSGNMNGLKELSYGNKMYDGSGNTITKMQNTSGSNTATDIEAKMTEIKSSDANPDNTDLSSWLDVKNYVSNSTAVGTYQVWDALHFFEEATPERPDAGKFASAPAFNMDQEISNANDGQPNELIPMTNSAKGSVIQRDNNGRVMVTIKESCKYIMPKSSYSSRYGVVIDATDEDVYVYLDPNDSSEFSFYPGSLNSMNVLIKGSHSVIFVLPEGITYKMNDRSFVGHYELAKKQTGISDEFQLVTDCDLAQGNTDKWKNYLMEDSSEYLLDTITDENGEKYTVLDKNEFGSEPVHNNIFLVSRKNNKFDLTSTCVLAGYIYAPSTTMEITANGNNMKFFGGLIVGGFKYDHQDGYLAFCSPYDQYNGDGANVVSNLISQASDGVYGSPGSNDNKKQLSAEMLGYK